MTASLPAWLTAAALMSAATLTLYGFLLRTLPDLEPPSNRGGNPAIETGFQMLFVALGLLLAGLFAVRNLLIARAAVRGGGMLQPSHRRRLRKDRATAIWAVVVLTTFCVVAAGPRPGALPLAVADLVAAAGWAVAAIGAVRAERANAPVPRQRRT